jgi:hypothetical protein
MFDAKQEIDIRLLPLPDGTSRSVRLRFPTDQEWIDRYQKRKPVIRQLGRGQSETTLPSGDIVDAELLASICLDGTVVDDFEANQVIERLAEAEVADAEQEGAHWRITLRVPGGDVQHVMACPTIKDIVEYRRKFARLIDLPHGKQQLTVNLIPAGELHARLVQSVSGYSDPGAIPIVHRAAAVRAVIDEVELYLRGSDPGNSQRGNGRSSHPSGS